MAKYHVLIIGGGQIGSRHLQVLALKAEDLYISVVDPSRDQLILAEERFHQIKKDKLSKRPLFLRSVSEVKGVVDLCIYATTAQHRLQVLKESLLSQAEIKNILFEKVLFQSEQQLDEAKFLIKENKLILCPLEKLQRQKLGSLAIEEVKIDDRLDQLFKPGLYQQLNSFLKGDVQNLCSIQEHLENCKHYLKMANY